MGYNDNSIQNQTRISPNSRNVLGNDSEILNSLMNTFYKKRLKPNNSIKVAIQSTALLSATFIEKQTYFHKNVINQIL